MSKTWLVAFEEVRRNAFKKSFILVLFSVPFFITMMILPGIIMEELSKNDLPIGYVDLSGAFQDARMPETAGDNQRIDVLAFSDTTAASAALDAGEIQAFYVFGADYLESRQVELVFDEKPDSDATRDFYDFVQVNLLSELPPQAAWRAADGSSTTIESPDGARSFPSGAPPIGAVIPIIFGFAMGGLLLMGAGSLMTGLIDEKSNRTMEVIATSISPSRMITGKLSGILAVSLFQLAFWILIGILAIWLAGSVFEVKWFQNPTIEWPSLLAVVAVALPGYVFASAVLFALGATVVNVQEGQSIGPLVFMAMMIPLYTLPIIANSPDGAVAVTLTLLPLTSILTVGIRSMLSVVPAWQILASAVIQVFCAVMAVWLAGKAFRLGMLRYGQRLRFGELFGRSRKGAQT